MKQENPYAMINNFAQTIRAERAQQAAHPHAEIAGLDEVMDGERRRGFIHDGKSWVGHTQLSEPVARNGGRS